MQQVTCHILLFAERTLGFNAGCRNRLKLTRRPWEPGAALPVTYQPPPPPPASPSQPYPPGPLSLSSKGSSTVATKRAIRMLVGAMARALALLQ